MKGEMRERGWLGGTRNRTRREKMMVYCSTLGTINTPACTQPNLNCIRYEPIAGLSPDSPGPVGQGLHSLVQQV